MNVPTLIGVGGHFAGEAYALEYGRTLIVGRSRKADFSLKRTEVFRNQTPEARDGDDSAHTVSARHFQITMFNLRSIEIKNLSVNGTQLDGKWVESAIVNDISQKPHEIRFGLDEVLRLEMKEQKEA